MTRPDVQEQPGGGRRATLIGLAAILLWSGVVGLMRLVTESFGPLLGAALVYSVATALLWLSRRPRSLRTFPRRYLLIGGALFVLYELMLSLSVGLAASKTQAIEVSIVNYLWPTLTVLLATAGIVLALSGDAGISLPRIEQNIASNPLPYALALIGAVTWALYSVLTPRISQGRDGITLFFTAITATLWIVYLANGAPAPAPPTATGFVALAGAGVVMAAGYSCWNVGILHGSIRTLSTASYATPILSSAVAALLLGAALPLPFWAGVVLVVAGSLLSWWATRSGTSRTAHEEQ